LYWKEIGTAPVNLAEVEKTVAVPILFQARRTTVPRHFYGSDQEGLSASCEDSADELRAGQGISAKAGTYVYSVIVDRDSLSG
jgi:hypothetical protein